MSDEFTYKVYVEIEEHEEDEYRTLEEMIEYFDFYSFKELETFLGYARQFKPAAANLNEIYGNKVFAVSRTFDKCYQLCDELNWVAFWTAEQVAFEFPFAGQMLADGKPGDPFYLKFPFNNSVVVIEWDPELQDVEGV